MSVIKRLGGAQRWADVVIHNGVARWVEVAADMSTDVSGQIQHVFRQIDETLSEIGSNRDHLLEVVVYLASLDSVSALNSAWDAWVSPGHAPIRACVQVGLQGNCLVEMIVVAAVE